MWTTRISFLLELYAVHPFINSFPLEAFYLKYLTIIEKEVEAKHSVGGGGNGERWGSRISLFWRCVSSPEFIYTLEPDKYWLMISMVACK